MPQPAMRDPGGDLWVVGSEGRLGAGEKVCVRARAPSRLRPRAPGAPALGQQTAAAFGLVLFSSSSLCPLSRFRKESVFCQSLKGAWVPRSPSPHPHPPLFTDEKTNPADREKSHEEQALRSQL